MENKLLRIKGFVLNEEVFNYVANRNGEGLFDSGFGAESYELTANINNVSDIDKLSTLLGILRDSIIENKK